MHTFAHLYFFNHSNEQKVLDGLFAHYYVYSDEKSYSIL